MTLRSVLILSLGANAILLGYTVYRAQQPQEQVLPQAPEAAPIFLTNVVSDPVVPSLWASEPTSRVDWSQLEHGAYDELIDALRGVGCPEPAIQDMVVGAIDRDFEAKHEALVEGVPHRLEYWKTGAALATRLDPKVLAEQEALEESRRAMIQELFREELLPEYRRNDGDVTGRPLALMLRFLPTAKRRQVMDVERDFAWRRAVMLPGESAVRPIKRLEGLHAFYQEKEATVAEVLSEEELTEYRLRRSFLAQRLRAQLEGFEPTEQEFREIFELRHRFEQAHGIRPPLSEEGEQQWEEARAKMEAEIEELLGEDRFVQYKRVQDDAYQIIAEVGEEGGFARNQVIEVYEMKQIAEDHARRLRTNFNIPRENLEAALREIRAETERSIADIVGTNGLSLYKRHGAGWLTNISPDEPKLDDEGESGNGPTIIESFP